VSKTRRSARGQVPWAGDAGDAGPSPFFSTRLFGLERRRLDMVLSVGLLLAVGLSRWAAFPASIWEQDEAYFAAAVRGWDVAVNHPHPPWFPLWVAIGRLLLGLRSADPAFGLRLASAVLGTWTLFPLVALWSLVVRRHLAVAATVLFLFTPASWLLAGRAFSETPATAFLLLALACWLRPGASAGMTCVGSAAAAAAMLVRPHVAPGLLIPAAWWWWRNRRSAAALLTPMLVVTVAGGIGLVAASGGVQPLLEALTRHAGYHFGALPTAPHDFASSGLSRALGHPVAAAAWLLLALVGAWRSRSSPSARLLALGALLPGVVLVLSLANPAHARYTVPLLALSSGLVVVGATAVIGRATPAGVAVAILASGFAVVPALGVYRREISPPVAAVRAAFDQASSDGAIVVADRTLVAFVDYARASGSPTAVVIWDHQVESRAVPPPSPRFAVAVYDRGHDRLYRSARERSTFECREPLLCALSQDRFLEVTVAIGVEVEGYAPGKPLILIGGYGAEGAPPTSLEQAVAAAGQNRGGRPACLQSSLAVMRSRERWRLTGMVRSPFV
jgi:hypothetical protein